MTAQRQPLSKFIRVGLSVLIVAHLLAVVLPPLSFQTQPSPSVSTLLAPVEGYGQFLYVDRGYAFFAPDPGPSHLVQAAVKDDSGNLVEKMFPDRQQQFPRLLYHRYFMLTEFLEEIYQPPTPPELAELDAEEAAIWERARSRYEHVRTSFVEHLKHEHPGKEVAIRRVEHLIPNIVEYQNEPIELTDPRLYQVLFDLPIDLSEGSDGDLTAPSRAPETIPPPTGQAIEQSVMSDSSGSQGNQDAADESAEVEAAKAEQEAKE
ncbi:MAG: hypothetical protein AB8B91_15940 [Rubripirellula sp.]